jgi:Chaperone of endosialidase
MPPLDHIGGIDLPPESIITAIYDYCDHNDQLLFQVLRFSPKNFRTLRLDSQNNWILGLRDTNPVLYRLAEVIRAETVLVVEGEKDVETARMLGLPSGWAATTSPFGAGAWIKKYAESLRAKSVVICPDTDPAGQYHLMQVGLSLANQATQVRVVKLPPPFKDLTQWVESGGTGLEFLNLIHHSEEFGYPRSDEELKQNIQPLSGMTDRLLQLQGVEYEWQAPEQQGNLTGTQIGLIAQAVESVFPEWIGTGANGFKTLSISGFEALAIESLRELKTAHDQLSHRFQRIELETQEPSELTTLS